MKDEEIFIKRFERGVVLCNLYSDEFILDIAKAVHNTLQAIDRHFGNKDANIQFELTKTWYRASLVNNIEKILFLDKRPKELHEFWLRKMEKFGWSYGTEFDSKLLKHPNMTSWDQLPCSVKLKNNIIRSITISFRKH